MTSDPWAAVLLVVATFGTAVLSAVAGFGGGVVLLPVFVAVFGAPGCSRRTHVRAAGH